jgi:pilus assembly protein CpaE
LAPSGGSGSSTLAANLATVLANENRTALLLDLRLETNDLASLMDLRPTHTLGELCQNVDRVDADMFERSLVKHASGVRLLAPPASFADARHITPEGVHQALNLGRTLYPFVVVDVDNSLREEQLKALREADLIVIVLRLEFASLRNTQRALDYLDRMGINRERVLLVVNRYGQPKEVPAAKAEEALGAKITEYLPDDPKTVIRANNNGVPVVLESPSAKVSKCISRLAQNITSRLKNK